MSRGLKHSQSYSSLGGTEKRAGKLGPALLRGRETGRGGAEKDV